MATTRICLVDFVFPESFKQSISCSRRQRHSSSFHTITLSQSRSVCFYWKERDIEYLKEKKQPVFFFDRIVLEDVNELVDDRKRAKETHLSGNGARIELWRPCPSQSTFCIRSTNAVPQERRDPISGQDNRRGYARARTKTKFLILIFAMYPESSE